MSEAPERIWVWWDDGYDIGLVNTHGDERYTPKDAREYVRASRIEQLAAINEELEAKLAESEARSEVLETLVMDVAADLYDGVAAHKIDQRIMDVFKQLDEEEEDQ